jgi:hypothetical protein
MGPEAHKWLVLTRYIHKHMSMALLSLLLALLPTALPYSYMKNLKTYFNIVVNATCR